ncbi:MAG: restriction endonuclease, partial [Treponema sp.]|nr:restriction endonuclease [Treponema sp.]
LATCYEKNHKIDKAIEQWQIIYQNNRSFRDVGAKLSEYKDLQSNDALKEFLTCSQEEFAEICKKTALKGLGMTTQSLETKKWGIQILATEAKSDDWMNLRKQTFLLNFYRETEPIEDSEIRRVLDLAKQKNCTKAYALASSGFTSTASSFAENRPIELVGKNKLEAILAKVGV